MANKRLSNKEESDLFQGLIRGYIVLKSPRSVRLSNAFFRQCSMGYDPFITVTLGRKYAHVLLDMITCNPPTLGPEATMEARLLIEKYAVPPCWLSLGPVILSCSRVDKDKAEELASLLYKIVKYPRID